MRPGIQAHVDSDRCTGCGVCMQECPFSAIEVVEGKAAVAGPCGGCMVCVPACPEQAIAPVRLQPIEDEAPGQAPWGGAPFPGHRHRGW